MSVDRKPHLELAENKYVEVADPKLLRRTFGAFATGVTVVTVGGETPHGMTANSFTSVSLDPPLVLVCVGRNAVVHQILSATGTFGVSVLAGHQETAARHFADRLRPLGSAQFDAVDWQPGRHTSAPLVTGALARFECELWNTYDGGDHSIFVGKVVSLERSIDQDGLLFFQGRFREITPQRQELSA
jgi:flavin reductase